LFGILPTNPTGGPGAGPGKGPENMGPQMAKGGPINANKGPGQYNILIPKEK
jgi:hypothetical protein